jgi:hypothetical protein
MTLLTIGNDMPAACSNASVILRTLRVMTAM